MKPLPKGLSEAVPKGLSKAVTKGVGEAVTKGVGEAVPARRHYSSKLTTAAVTVPPPRSEYLQLQYSLRRRNVEMP